MPPSTFATFRSFDHGLTVTARTKGGDDRRAHLRLTGEIDMAAFTALSETIDWLTALAPTSVVMDLAELTFACSTLPNFIVRVRHAMPDGAELILWRPAPTARWVLGITGMAAIATLHDEPVEPPAVFV